MEEVEPVRYDANTYISFGLKEGDRKTYEQAKSDCRDKRAALVTVRDNDEHEDSLRILVEDYFENNPDWNSLKFWVGYKVSASGDSLIAVDGKESTYVESRVKSYADKPDGCVFGNKMRSVVVQDNSTTVDFDTFAAADEDGCGSMRPYMCEWSDCSICDTCVERVYNQFTSQVVSLGLSSISQILDGTSSFRGWKTLCNDVFEANKLLCKDASALIAASANNDFNFAKRPAALCAVINECEAEDECMIVSQEPGTTDGPHAMDFCTVDGTAVAQVLGTKTYAGGLEGDECLRDSDCNTGEFCNTSDSTEPAFACNSATGTDESRPKGTCANLCKQPGVQDAKEQVKELFPPSVICSNPDGTQGDCAAGFLCLEAVDACRTNFNCDASSGVANVTFDDCPGMCLRQSKNLVSAEFSNDGGSIKATLDAKARMFDAPCSSVFDADTVNILGQSASCYISKEAGRETLIINLGGDATIDPLSEDVAMKTLRLNRDASSPLKDLLQGDLYQTPNGDGVIVGVTNEENLVPPTQRLAGPATVKESCPGEAFGTVFIDSSASGDASDRPLESRTWGLRSGGADPICVSHDINDENDLLSVAVKAANPGNFTTLRLENETLSEMQAGVHCITLTVTNFLGKSSDTQDPAELTIEKLVRSHLLLSKPPPHRTQPLEQE